MSPYSRLIRFLPSPASASDQGQPLIGEPVDSQVDVGLAIYHGQEVQVEVFSGKSILDPGTTTGRRETVGKLLSPLARGEVGTIRCIGLNYHNHAKEINMSLPEVPTLFLKPNTALGDPYPTSPTNIPRNFVGDCAADWEAELTLVIGKECKDVGEGEAMDYLLGYTGANDVSSRVAQFAQSQWCYSKGFDGSCPLGPVFVPACQVKKVGEMEIRGSLNGRTVQESKLSDLIFSVPKIISFVSQGTTLLPGTIILTGTPAGIGWSASPRRTLKDGDEFSIHISHGVGSLISKFVEEK